ncbi:arylesterase [Catenovulum sediminis]|uniref:Arylesterase n=1 Tax=Catenovulum sediminis TaxID=1740262 RepID=A0ABV1RLD1_9ALTE
MRNPLLTVSKRISWLFILSLTLIVHSAQSETKLLILGDSLSAGYGLEIEDAWASKIQKNWSAQQTDIKLINASVSGETTQGGLNRLPNLLKQHQPDYVFVELGGNDGLRGIQLPVIKQNLMQIVQLIKQNNAQPILAEIKIPPNYGPRYLKIFIQQFSDIAQQFAIPLVPFFIEDIAAQPQFMMKDGIHPNKEAQPIIAKKMQQVFEEIIKR